MRKLALLSFSLLSLLACTAILGDFSVGTTTGDAGDSGSSDAPLPPDSGDAGGGDGGGDGGDAGVLKLLTCGDNPTQRRQLTPNNSSAIDKLVIMTLPNGLVRVIVSDYAGYDGGGSMDATLRAYTYDPHQSGNVTEADAPVKGQVLDIERYGGTNPGVVALSYNYGDSSISATTLSNAANTWSTSAQLSQPVNIYSNVEGTIAAIDAANNDYYVAIEGIAQTSTANIYAGEAKPGGQALPSVRTDTLVSGRAPYSLVAPGIALFGQGQQAYVMLNADGANGPPAPGTPTLMLSMPGSVVQVSPPTGLNVFPAGFTNAVDPAKVNAAFLIVDLNFNVPPTYHVGQLSGTSLTAIDPTSLPATPLVGADGGAPTLDELIVSNNASHWEVSNNVEQLLMTAATTDPVTQTFAGGVNFGWWEATTGKLRAFRAGKGGQLIADIPFPVKTDITIGAISGSIASLYLAYEKTSTMPSGNNFPPPVGDIWVANIGCSP